MYNLAEENMKEDDERDKGERKEYLAVFELKDGEAVATSGDYESKHVVTTCYSRSISYYGSD